MTRIATLADVRTLYAARGGLHYGEGVTQLEHALQCAAIAEASGGAPSLVAAALLHDIGRLLLDDEDMTFSNVDGRHETAGAAMLAGLFGAEARQPIALHVAAKRYLCLREPAYREALSPASRHSLAVQGGAYGPAEALLFERSPWWRDAVALRRFDDAGKAAEAPQGDFDTYLPLLASLSIAHRRE